MSNLTENEKKAQQLIVKEVNNALEMLELHFKKYCEEVAPLYNDGKKQPVFHLFTSSKA
jgi:hypothetical protein